MNDALIESPGGIVRETRDMLEQYIKAEVIHISVSDAGTSLSVPAVRKGNDVQIIPLSEFENYRQRPRFRHGTAIMLSLESLIEHANRFKDLESVFFANNDRAAPTMTVVLDYHPSGAASAPRFGKHRGHYAFPLSDEWKAWMDANGKPMKMAAFAEFLEERIIDVQYLIPGEDEISEDLQKFITACGGDGTIATPQRLMELARGLQVYESSAVKEAVRLASGEGQVSFDVTHHDQDGKPLTIPGLFILAIPVFKMGAFYRIAARLRYRKTGEGIVFWYDLWRTDRTFDHAFDEACELVKAETGLPVLLGKPE